MLSFALLLTRAVATNDEPFGSGVVVGRPAGAARYFTVVDAGRRGLDAPGAVWVLGRTGDWPDAFPHSGTRIWLGASSSNLLGPPAADLPVDENASANLGALAGPRGLELAGGLENLQVPEARRGIRVFQAPTKAALLRGAFATSATIRGGAPGCLERRRVPHKIAPGVCEFDGRVSLARRADGDVFLYARANLRQKNGGRYVQVARRRAGGGWQSFAPLQVDGYPWQQCFDRNVYFAAVNANPADGSTLLALMPVNDGARAFVGLSLSCDGARFSALRPVLASTMAPYGRSSDHPADGLLEEPNGDVSFFVHRDVPGIAAPGTAATLVRLSLPRGDLANYTAHAKRTLKRRGWCDDGGAWPPPRPPGPDWLWGPQARRRRTARS